MFPSLCTGATPIGSGFFSSQSLSTIVTAVNCTGSEVSLSQCSYVPVPVEDNVCSHDAAVICQGELNTGALVEWL